MKKEQISELFERFENARYLLEGVECWSARELQTVFNYSEWRNFTKVIDKARESCENAGIPVSDHFVDVNKMIALAKGAQRQVADVALTRYACYLIAQNGEINLIFHLIFLNKTTLVATESRKDQPYYLIWQ